MSDNDNTLDWSDGSDDYGWSGTSIPSDESVGPLSSRTRSDSGLIKTYYTVYMGLSNGSSSRQALPPELALYICRLADFECWYTKKAPEGVIKVNAWSQVVRSLMWFQTEPFTKKMLRHVKSVNAWSQVVRSLMWFQTEPFTKKMLRHVKSVQLVTMSHHQGWVSDRNAGSWSWFEFQVARPTDQDATCATAKLRPNGDEISWRCLAHPVDRKSAKRQNGFAEHKGSVFDSDHELWTQIEEGDVLQVVMKARFGGWSNTASDGILRIGTWWEPSIEMLRLMDKNHSDARSK
ncbi:hypothetical protein RSAG8_01973, partial [Rhizoctonia solani AG-8 WAC10335]